VPQPGPDSKTAKAVAAQVEATSVAAAHRAAHAAS